MHGQIIRSRDELCVALSSQVPVANRRLGEILVDSQKLISRSQLDELLLKQRSGSHKRLGALLVDHGLISQEQVYMALAMKFGIPYVRLDDFEIQAEVITRIPAEVAFRYNIMPLAIVGTQLIVAMENPLDLRSIEALSFAVSLKPEVAIAPMRDITLAQSKYYSRFDEREALRDRQLAPLPYQTEGTEPLHVIEAQARKKPLVRLMSAIVLQGVVRGASDINIRPDKERIQVYYRVDGVMQLARSMDKSLLRPLICRIKVMGGMDIAERRLPQDGHVRLMRGKRHIDLRVSTIPTIDGESVVIRILDKEVGLKPLEGLGLARATEDKIRALIAKQNGLFLVVGPTGSGKSTTLYALLNEIRKEEAHIVTIEDPVEYEIAGVEQVQVVSSREMGFSDVLRSILRHDPDVIMVGEIRDGETAEIANRAALTGHFVLSTLHTDDCIGTVIRLFDMGIKPYLLAATLRGVLAQRLVRANCRYCAEPVETGSAIRERFHLSVNDTPLAGRGCDRCNQTGFQGRVLVCEVLIIDAAMAALINTVPDLQVLKEKASLSGAVSLGDDLARLVREGQVAPVEALALC